MTNSDEKVYCRGCKYLFLSLKGATFKCSHPKNIEERDTPLERKRNYYPIEFFNSNNDYPYYERTLVEVEEAKKEGIWEKLNRIRKEYCFL